MTDKRVLSFGPLDAPIAWVGESPGPDEVLTGKPFVGASGQLARATLRQYGIDPETQVYWSNCCQLKVLPWPGGRQGAQLLHDWAGVLDEDLAKLTNCKVVVTCGGVAMQRLTGLTDLGNHWGSVLRRADIAGELKWHSSVPLYTSYLPENALVIPIWHPAGIMKDPGRGATPEFQRTVGKIARTVAGALQPLAHTCTFYPSLEVLTGAAENANTVVIDTEYHRETKALYWVGITFDGAQIYGFPWTRDYMEFMRDLCLRQDLLKVMQNASADIRSLRQGGVPLTEPYYDTMLAHYTLWPGLDVGLDDQARFYLDDVKNWKGMDHADPHYNALDVLYTWHIWQAQLAEARRRPVDPIPSINDRIALVAPIMAMEDGGMRVNKARRTELIEELNAKITEIEATVTAYISPAWQLRVDAAARELLVKETLIEQYKEAARGACICSKHKPGVSVLRQGAPKCPECYLTWAGPVLSRIRGTLSSLVKDRNRTKVLCGRYAEGFQWSSPEHVGWLLYTQLQLPIKETEKGKPATDAKTIEVLCERITEAVEKGNKKSKYYIEGNAVEIIKAIKSAQEHRKAISTFLEIPLDTEGVLRYPHLSYKIHGTETGRLAGGQDKKGDLDKLPSEGHSLMNMPNEWRVVYEPPPNEVYVYVDYSNQEGRLAAYVSRDTAYQVAFAEEERTGTKVHSQVAALLFGIEPKDAKTFQKTYKGTVKTGYEIGKAANHASAYSLDPVLALHYNFGMDLGEAVRIADELRRLRPHLAAFKQTLVREVLGVWEPHRGHDGKWRAMCTIPGRRYYATAFGWQRYWYGMGKVATHPVTGRMTATPVEANELLAFALGQSPGASIWSKACRSVYDAGLRIATGTYDSLMVTCPRDVTAVKETAALLKELTSQPWPQLGGLTLPVECKVGRNWGDYHPVKNPDGLMTYERED